MIGRTLGHYRILSQIGAGGMGVVYEAEDTRLHRRVAIKLLPPEMSASAERLARFEREAKVVASLNHPNIVTLHSVEEVEGVRFLTMERIEGKNLRRLLKRGPLAGEAFLEIAIPLADAVHAAHQRGIVHRDLKPSNLMITAGGHLKVLDFGLARPGPRDDESGGSRASTATLTAAHGRMGTIPYMSPEQARGASCDHRTDIFSLGSVLYEMATGMRPFHGDGSAEVVSAILRDEPPSASDVNDRIPRQLSRIIAHCLEKVPERRFQTALDLCNELQSLQRELEREKTLSATARIPVRRDAARRRRALAAGVVGAVLVVTALFVSPLGRLLRPSGDLAPTAGEALSGAAADGRLSIAVLYFQDLQDDPQLEWLRGGLTEMLVTDLAESPAIRVLSTDRLYQGLKELDALETPVISSVEIARLARRTGVGAVLRGNYAQVGQRLQIGVTLQNVGSGEALVSKSVAGDPATELFEMVDELSRAIRAQLEPGATELAGDRRLRDVTTSSVEAFRYYTEGMQLHRQVKEKEALALFERAVEIDPDFAMALARLSMVELNLGRGDRSLDYARRALENVERLPGRERYYVEASYYYRRWRTYERAINAFETGLELYPGESMASHDLAILYASLERYEEAVELWERRRRKGGSFGGTYYSLVNAYAALGRRLDGEAAVEDFEAENPTGWYTAQVRGWHEAYWGRGDEALAAFAEADRRRPGAPDVDEGRWHARVLTGDLGAAERAADRLIGSDDPFWRWLGLGYRAQAGLYRGRASEATELLARASAAFAGSDANAAATRCRVADVLLSLGRPEEALAEALLAVDAGVDEWPQLEGLFLAARAAGRLGREAEAERLSERLAALTGSTPLTVERRLQTHLAGLRALDRGDHAAAIRELEEARSSLPPRPIDWHWHRAPDHIPIWFALATAHLEAGDDESAVRWFGEIAGDSFSRLRYPIRYVRSLYHLGVLQHRRGDDAAARATLERFLALWGEGELDRERVGEARRLAG